MDTLQLRPDTLPMVLLLKLHQKSKTHFLSNSRSVIHGLHCLNMSAPLCTTRQIILEVSFRIIENILQTGGGVGLMLVHLYPRIFLILNYKYIQHVNVLYNVMFCVSSCIKRYQPQFSASVIYITPGYVLITVDVDVKI